MDREPLTDEELRMLRMPISTTGGVRETAELQNAAIPKQDQRLIDLHVEFAAQLGQTLTDVARRQVQVRLRDEWLGMYAEFVFGQTVPTCCAVVCSRSRDLEFYLVFDPMVLYPILDRLLGSRITEPVPSRPLSEIERQVTRILMTEIIGRYCEIWKHTLSLDLVIDRIEHNVQQMHAIRGTETTYHVRYEITLDAAHGLIEFCLPWDKTARLRERLAADAS